MIQKAFEIENFLSEHEVVFLENIQKRLKKTFNLGNVKKAYTNGFNYNLIKQVNMIIWKNSLRNDSKSI